MNIQNQIRILEALLSSFQNAAETVPYSADFKASHRTAFVEAIALRDFLVAERDKPEHFVWVHLPSSAKGTVRHETALDYFITADEKQAMLQTLSRKPYDEAQCAAIDRVKALGGRMVRGKPVFSSYDRPNLVRRIGEIVGRKFVSIDKLP